MNEIVLNEEQSAAVKYGVVSHAQQTQGPLLINAGAGTGKTGTLAHRTAELILNGVSPDKILLVTFARRAANELASRTNKIIAYQCAKSKKVAPPVKLSWMGTFHSIANRLLRVNAESIGLDPNFVIMDRGDSEDLLDLVRHDLGFSKTQVRFPKKSTCLGIYSRCINAQQSLEEILDNHYPYCSEWLEELKLLFAAYTKAKVEQNSLDYDDLLLYCFHMSKVPQIAKLVRAQFDQILVDEYQDTNVLQAGILLNFFPTGEGLTVVGDDAQSIYAFRSATVDNILNFADLFKPKAKIISLKQNYRSHQKILDLSNALLAESSEGYKVALVSNKKEGLVPKLVTVEDDSKQAEYIVEQVLKAREAGTKLKQQAVLFRSSYHSDRLELELTRKNIPYVKYGGLKFLEAAHVKDLLGILRWSTNPKYKVSAFRVLKLLPGIGPKMAEKVFHHLELNQFEIGSLKQFKIPEAAKQYFTILCTLIYDVHHHKVDWTDQVNQIAHYYKDLLEINYDDHFVRYGDIEQLIQLSQQYQNRDQFLTEFTLDPPSSSGDLSGKPLTDDDFLILSTVHSAKGQEWKNVHVLNVADGNFPNEYAAGDSRALEEERRLLNVAITRAQVELHLIQPLKYWVPEQQKYGSKHVYGAKSRFLTESVMLKLNKTHYPDESLSADQIIRNKKAIINIKQTVLGLWVS